MRLVQEQKAFLKRHGILIDQVMDASGMPASKWKVLIKDSEYIVAVGVTKCQKKGHSMRSHAGHCVMCDPAKLAFQMRHRSKGQIYIMYSSKNRLVKVGVASSAITRQVSLNQIGYGNIKDWNLKYKWQVSKSGAVEKKVHQLLREYSVSISHSTGNSNSAGEIFTCSVKKAKEMVESIID